MQAIFPILVHTGPFYLANGEELYVDETGEPAGFVFKTLSDPYVGRMSFIKVLSGYLEPGMELMNARSKKKERLSHLYVMMGKEPMDVKSAKAGDIIVVPKMNETKTGDTLSLSGDIEVDPLPSPGFRFTPSPLKLKTRRMRISWEHSFPSKRKLIQPCVWFDTKKLINKLYLRWATCM